MKIKRDITIRLSILGAFLGLVYFVFSVQVFEWTSLFLLFSTTLYFSLLGLLVSILVLFFSNVKIDRWHVGAILGYLFYLVSSMLLYAFYVRGKVSVLRDVIFLGPIPGFILQICLILLGLTLGMYLSNTDLIKLKIRR